MGFGKSKGRPLSVVAHVKCSVVEVKATENCLAHAIIIAIAKLENDANYKSYRDVYTVRFIVRTLQEGQVSSCPEVGDP